VSTSAKGVAGVVGEPLPLREFRVAQPLEEQEIDVAARQELLLHRCHCTWIVVCGSVARRAANWVARQPATPWMTVIMIGMASGDSTSVKMAMPAMYSDMHQTMTVPRCRRIGTDT
jgi:hypothetical protein